MASDVATSAVAVTPEQFLAHWQGHRRLTRRMIEAFPEDQLFTYSIGGMRPFGALALEMLAMTAPMVKGLVQDEWGEYDPPKATSRADLLRQWDEATEALETWWPQLPASLFQEVRTVFGQYTSQVYDLLLYGIDNEIHHRGQGYVYLRALGIEPPAFYAR